MWRQGRRSVQTAAAAPAYARGDARRATIDRMLRVDHAGEYGAIRIYDGQMAVLGRGGDPALSATLRQMKEQEREHLAALERRMPERRARPSALLPIWGAAGYALGFGTALLGKEAAMACTVAVEEVIASHYNDQLRDLMQPAFDKEDDLRHLVAKHRDEEMEHRDIGIEHDALRAPAYQLLSTVIKTGCRAAIWISERV